MGDSFLLGLLSDRSDGPTVFLTSENGDRVRIDFFPETNSDYAEAASRLSGCAINHQLRARIPRPGRSRGGKSSSCESVSHPYRGCDVHLFT
jgi:hypothetical protein